MNDTLKLIKKINAYDTDFYVTSEGIELRSQWDIIVLTNNSFFFYKIKGKQEDLVMETEVILAAQALQLIAKGNKIIEDQFTPIANYNDEWADTLLEVIELYNQNFIQEQSPTFEEQVEILNTRAEEFDATVSISEHSLYSELSDREMLFLVSDDTLAVFNIPDGRVIWKGPIQEAIDYIQEGLKGNHDTEALFDFFVDEYMEIILDFLILSKRRLFYDKQ